MCACEEGSDRMRRKFGTGFTMFLMLILLVGSAVSVSAADDPSYFFELSVDGKDTKEVEPGDIITVVLRLKRMDEDKPYTMYAMQDEVRYDSTFLELVEGSAMLGKGVSSTDIALVDQYREFYMNYLSMSGGEKWEADTLVGSFQLKVVGESGVTKITSQDYLVSLQDGSGSFPCEANEVTIVISTACRVSFKTNGGSEIADQTVQFGEKINRPKDPVREGYVFGGWYTDIHLSDEWDFEQDTVQGNMSLYAKWNVEEAEDTDINQPTTEAEEPDTDDVITGDTAGSLYLWWMIIFIITLVLLSVWYNKRKKDKRINAN